MKPLRPDDPRRVGRYRTLAALGEGGMGRVLLAVAPDGRFAAVKHVFASLAGDPVFRDRFRREVAASRLVSGAYTAPVLDADTESDTPWLASAYVPGPTLADVLEANGPLDVGGVRHLALTLAVALADIHRAGLVHRDLKPGNVLLTHDGPRVIDFGIARALDESGLTATGALIGSPAFMSPEQALGTELTPASDVFSLGSLLVTAATGQRPFAAPSTPQTLFNVAHGEPDLSPLPAEVRAFVEPCLAKDPASRPTSRQLVELLGSVPPGMAPWPPSVAAHIARQEQLLRTVVAAPPPPPAPSPAAPVRRRHGRSGAAGRVGVPLAAFAAALAAVLVVVLTTGGGESPPPDDAAPEPAVGQGEALAAEWLRRVDPCAVLAGVSVPGLGTLTPEDAPFSLHRCRYDTTDGTVRLGLGEDLYPGAREGGAVAGRPVLLTNLTGGCEASAQLTDEPELVVTVSDSSARTCEGPEAVLAEALPRLRTDRVLRELPADSALAVEMCGLLPDGTVRELLGPATASGTGLHGCEWDGERTVRVRVQPGVPGLPPEENAEPVTLDGVEAHATSDGEYCAITWQHRRINDDLSEEVSVFYLQSDGDPCERAQRLAAEVVTALPRA
ncbi:serine/threonine protein kinase [Saccharomonospora piscinae]|uniref:Serine/threonine protein kinase n=1 Tax=Saccharomonospora piscinae TaxID=687388 RepID=A0A1V9A5Y1_SACPI|nr:serine/threonine-protein kinase [Saccharomonospora piscinae]OQO92542.1 serine/threonine protein kinase [Saccharomonospora piscinae]TLW91748.1 serine/threonine protein kinase [Saccharomonospora piscinae]